MKIYRRLLLFLVILCGFSISLILLPKQSYFVVGHNSDVMRPYVAALVDNLNKSSSLTKLKDDECAHIAIYSLNWVADDTVPTLSKDEKKCAILWLGSQQNLLDDDLTQYHSVWASTPLLQSFLKSLHIPSIYVPIFALNEPFSSKKSSLFFAIIGQQPDVKKLLEQMNLPFKQYDITADIINIQRDLPSFRAIFVNSTRFTPSSIDIHPIFLEAAQNEIPIFAPWLWPQEDTINLFNDRISFYSDISDLDTLLHNFLHDDNKFTERSQSAAKLVEREFTLQRNLKRILAQNSNIDALTQFSSPAHNTATINIPTAVGHYTAGDYALAKDLEAYLVRDLTSVDLTFYNSLYRYPSEINILFRGFLPPADYDLQASYNILYLAYAQFVQNDSQELLPAFDDYLSALQQSAQRVDAFVVASQKLSDTLNARGTKTYYIPQFTNTSRFYPDFDENLKSDVLFVGVNAFYRTAVPALLQRGVKVDVYGPNWPQGVAKADYADNQILRKYYSSAKIVLNDTREGMKKFGFISNRIFDATACGTLVISDYMPEIEQIYGDSVPMYHNDDELYELVQYFLTHDEERIEKAQRAQKITLQNFTADMAAEKFLNIINLLKNK